MTKKGIPFDFAHCQEIWEEVVPILDSSDRTFGDKVAFAAILLVAMMDHISERDKVVENCTRICQHFFEALDTERLQ